MNSLENWPGIKSRLSLIQNSIASSPSSCGMLVYKHVTSYEYKAEGDVNSLGSFRIKSRSSLMHVLKLLPVVLIECQGIHLAFELGTSVRQSLVCSLNL